MTDPARRPPFALMAEFHSSRELIHAIRESHKAGYKQLEAYTQAKAAQSSTTPMNPSSSPMIALMKSVCASGKNNSF